MWGSGGGSADLLRILEVSLRITLLGVNEVCKLGWVAQEKYRGVVAD